MLSDLVAKFGAAALKYGTIALVIIGLFLWGRHYQLEGRTQQQELIASREQVQNAQADIAALKDQYAKYQAAQSAELAAEKARSAKTITITRTITNAPETRSCGTSPAIRAVLDGLRVKPADAIPGTTAPATGKPAGLH